MYTQIYFSQFYPPGGFPVTTALRGGPKREQSDAAVLPGWCVRIVNNKLVDLVPGMEKKVCQSLHSRDQGMCSRLKQRSHVCYSSCNWSHHVVNLTITPCRSPGCLCPLHRPVQMIGIVLGITKSAPFKSLMTALMSGIPPGLWYCFQLVFFE